VASRVFDFAVVAPSGQALLVGHPAGEAETLVWRVRAGRFTRVSAAPWPAIGAAPLDDGAVIIGRDGQTLTVTSTGANSGTVDPRSAGPVMRGAATLGSGDAIAWGMAGKVYRRSRDGSWESWSIAPPLPRGLSVKEIIKKKFALRAIVGVAGEDATCAWAFGADGAAWQRSGGAWRPQALPVVKPWTCAASGPDGKPIVAGKGLVLARTGAHWRKVWAGELDPIAVAAFRDTIVIADGSSVWRVDGKTPKLVLSEEVEALATTPKGIVGVGGRAAFVSVDAERWAKLA
jgi:hypothetical protein